jgi:pantoate--beta-alanine ligase
MRAWRRAHGAATLAFVPTMGDLHAGHLALVECAARFGRVLVSIFVNPAQFGPGEDFAAYPRNLDADLHKLGALGLELAVFAPPAEEIYAKDAATWVEVGGVSEPLCGARRPGHFRGVATVVAKLFALTRPDLAVFGEKDAQQCLVLRQMVRDLHLPIELLFVPTQREPDGLALSSRNRYLDAEQRRLAGRLWAALVAGETALREGERDPERVAVAMHSACSSLDVEYAEVRALPGLERVQSCRGALLLAVAARIGRARLIDNLTLAVENAAVRRTPLLAEHSESVVRERLRSAGFELLGER